MISTSSTSDKTIVTVGFPLLASNTHGLLAVGTSSFPLSSLIIEINDANASVTTSSQTRELDVYDDSEVLWDENEGVLDVSEEYNEALELSEE